MWWGSKNPRGLKVTVRIFNLILGEREMTEERVIWSGIFSEEVLDISYSVKSAEIISRKKVHHWTRRVIIDRKKNRQIWDIF